MVDNNNDVDYNVDISKCDFIHLYIHMFNYKDPKMCMTNTKY